MLITNAKLRGQKDLVNILIKDNKIAKIGAEVTSEAEEEIIDARGNMVSAPYVDTHCHLDYV